MMTAGVFLLLGLLLFITLGAAGYLLSSRPAGKNRSMAMTIFAYGMISSSVALIPLSIFHFHMSSGFSLHVHGIGETLGLFMAECGIPLACAIGDLILLTGGVLLMAFILNQVASHILIRRFRKAEDAGKTKELRDSLGLSEKISLVVVRDAKPDAFSFALLERGRLFLPRSRDVIIISTGLIDLLEKDELRTVAAHELAHVKNADNRYLPFFHALSKLVFFDPLVRLLRLRIGREKEFSADRDAALVTRNPLGLARALTKILVHAKQGGNSAGDCSIFGSSKGDCTVERIRRLLDLADEMGQGY